MISDVNKKPPKKFRTAHVMAGLLLIVIVGGGMLWQLNRPPVMPLPQRHDHRQTLISTQPGELQSFTVHPQQAASYTLLVNGGALSVEGRPEFTIDDAVAQRMLDALLVIEAVDDFGPPPVDEMGGLSDYGLQSNAFRLEARYSQNRQVTLTIGDRIPGEQLLDYMMAQGSPNVYAIAIDIKDTFDRPLNLLHAVPKINFNAQLLNGFSLMGSQSLHLSKLREGVWELTEPFRYPADAGAISRLLEQIRSMRFATYVAHASPETLSQYGFDVSEETVVFHLSPSVIDVFDNEGQLSHVAQVDAQVLKIQIGRAIEGIGYYCLYEGVIYQASNLSMGFLDKVSAADYTGLYAADWPADMLEEFVVLYNHRRYAWNMALSESVLKNNELAVDAQGNTLFEYVIHSDGKEVKPEPIVSVYGALMRLRAAGILPSAYQPQGEAIVEIALRCENSARSIAFYAFDSLHVAVSVNGTALHYVTRAALDAFIEAFLALPIV